MDALLEPTKRNETLQEMVSVDADASPHQHTELSQQLPLQPDLRAPQGSEGHHEVLTDDARNDTTPANASHRSIVVIIALASCLIGAVALVRGRCGLRKIKAAAANGATACSSATVPDNSCSPVTVNAPTSVVVNLTVPMSVVGAPAPATPALVRTSTVSNVLAKSPFGPTVKRKSTMPPAASTPTAPSSSADKRTITAAAEENPSNPASDPAPPASHKTPEAQLDSSSNAAASSRAIDENHQPEAEVSAFEEHGHAAQFTLSSKALEIPLQADPKVAEVVVHKKYTRVFAAEALPASPKVSPNLDAQLDFSVTNKGLWKRTTAVRSPAPQPLQRPPAAAAKPLNASNGENGEGSDEDDVAVFDEGTARLTLHKWTTGTSSRADGTHATLPFAVRQKRKAALERTKEAARVAKATSKQQPQAPQPNDAASKKATGVRPVSPAAAVTEQPVTAASIADPLSSSSNVAVCAAPSLPATAEDPQPAPRQEPAASLFARYLRMLQIGVPRSAVEQKMTMEEPHLLSDAATAAEWKRLAGAPSAAASATAATAVPSSAMRLPLLLRAADEPHVKTRAQTQALSVPQLVAVTPTAELVAPPSPAVPPPVAPAALINADIFAAIDTIFASRSSTKQQQSLEKLAETPTKPAAARDENNPPQMAGPSHASVTPSRGVLTPSALSNSSPSTPRKTRISVLDGRRAQNVAIGLSRLKAYSPAALAAALKTLSIAPTATASGRPNLLTIAQAQLLLQQIPSPSEVQQIKQWASSRTPEEISSLAEVRRSLFYVVSSIDSLVRVSPPRFPSCNSQILQAEIFFYAIADVPQASARAAALVFRLTAADRVATVLKRSAMLADAAAQLKSSKALPTLLSTTRALVERIITSTASELAPAKLNLQLLPQLATARVPGAGAGGQASTVLAYLAAILKATPSTRTLAAELLRELSKVAEFARASEWTEVQPELLALRNNSTTLTNLLVNTSFDASTKQPTGDDSLGDPAVSTAACAPLLQKLADEAVSSINMSQRLWKEAIETLVAPMLPGALSADAAKPDAAAAGLVSFLAALNKLML